MTQLQEELSVRKIITIHYYEYMSNFAFQESGSDRSQYACTNSSANTTRQTDQ